MKPELKAILDKDLAGIKRPIALLCTDEDAMIGKTNSYIIAHLEILHDLKSTIGEYTQIQIQMHLINTSH